MLFLAMFTLLYLLSKFVVEKCDSLQVVKFPYPKNRFLVILRSFLRTYELFPGRGWFFSVSTFNEECFNENMSSRAGLNKSFSIS